jgi:prepilin-type processing-associated H-X9-DG protein
MQCSNNLKQLGLAAHNYHDAFKAFPLNHVWPHRPTETTGEALPSLSNMECWGWPVLMMPFFEQGNIYNQVGASRVSLMGYLSVPDATGQRLAFLMQDIPTLLCPSDSGGEAAKTAKDFRDGVGTSAGGHPRLWKPGLTNYASSRGVRNNHRRAADTFGMFMENKSVKIAECTDGTSNTFMFGERDSKNGRAGVWPGVRNPNGAGARGIDQNTAHVVAPLNSSDPPFPWTANDYGAGSGFGSLHTGGAQFVFADGSVHFISETIDTKPRTVNGVNVFDPTPNLLVYGTYQRLGRRNDGFVVSNIE